MREIKFRGWDPVIKYMAYSDGGFRQIVFGGSDDDVAIGMKLHFSIKNWDRWEDGKTQRSIKEIIFMQFTGLHDKNGKEICEGDIIKHYYKGGIGKEHFAPGAILPEDRILYVGWDESVPAFVLKDKRYPRSGVEMKEMREVGHSYWIGFLAYKSDEAEVIGNIYEHPELLETL